MRMNLRIGLVRWPFILITATLKAVILLHLSRLSVMQSVSEENIHSPAKVKYYDFTIEVLLEQPLCTTSRFRRMTVSCCCV